MKPSAENHDRCKNCKGYVNSCGEFCSANYSGPVVVFTLGRCAPLKGKDTRNCLMYERRK